MTRPGYLPVAPYAAYYLAMISCPAASAFWMIRRGHFAILFHVVMLSLLVSAQHALVYVEGRHRWGIEPLIGILAAAGIVTVLERRRQGRAGTGAAAAAER